MVETKQIRERFEKDGMHWVKFQEGEYAVFSSLTDAKHASGEELQAVTSPLASFLEDNRES